MKAIGAAVALALVLVAEVKAADPIPPCRLDTSLTPVVERALRWAWEDLQKNHVKFSFDSIVVNPAALQGPSALSVYVVKDAAASMVDRESRCIVRKTLPVGSPKNVVWTDGNCQPLDRTKCTPAEKDYMNRRFQEVMSFDSGDTYTGYEFTGACYMTNMQACLHRDFMDMMQLLGARDPLTVRGGCVADAGPPAAIRCSAGALKMLLSREAAAKSAPTLGIIFVLAHELSHLGAKESSSFDGDDHVMDLSLSPEEKRRLLRDECERGESQRSSERRADSQGLTVAKARLPQIRTLWPEQGTDSWLIMQAGHFSGNLARWNSDWHEGPTVTTPAVFLQQRDGGMVVIDEAASKHLDDEEPPSGKTPADIRKAAGGFLCEMIRQRKGRWDVLIQSGTTHGTLPARMGDVLALVRPPASDEGPIAGLEAQVGRISRFGVRRHATYLRELEAAICSLVQQPLECP